MKKSCLCTCLLYTSSDKQLDLLNKRFIVFELDILAALVVRLQYVQEIEYVEILLTGALFLQDVLKMCIRDR